MKKGIIFNAEMINAILQGQKTQTRRVVKYASENDFRHMDYDLEKGVMKFYTKVSGAWTLVRSVKCPFGKVGDKLWVKETWTEYDDGLVYRASYPQLDGVTKWQSPDYFWTPHVLMGRWGSRDTDWSEGCIFILEVLMGDHCPH